METITIGNIFVLGVILAWFLGGAVVTIIYWYHIRQLRGTFSGETIVHRAALYLPWVLYIIIGGLILSLVGSLLLIFSFGSVKERLVALKEHSRLKEDFFESLWMMVIKSPLSYTWWVKTFKRRVIGETTQ